VSLTKPNQIEKRYGHLEFDPYLVPTVSTRGEAIFRVHPYPTKIDYRSIIPLILAHTKPGEVVYDCFAGTCSTGFAAAACADKTSENSLNSNLKQNKAAWGTRRAICIDIGVLPTFIGRTLLRPIDIDQFQTVFNELMNEIESKWNWIYEAEDNHGNLGTIAHTVLSDVIRCTKCGTETRFCDLFVDFENGTFKNDSECPGCHAAIRAKSAKRTTVLIHDDLLDTTHPSTKRLPVTVYGRTGKRRWTRAINEKDLEVLSRVNRTLLPSSARAIRIPWGDLYRSGYHQNITHVHHLYTKRNFLALSLLYEAANKLPEQFRDHFILGVSSYNVAHSTLMARFVFKKGKTEPVITSGQPGVLYVSGCPVEKNVFDGVRRKFNDLRKAVTQINKWSPQVWVYRRPAQESGLPDNSVDYIFTDPPFAGNIPYSEINFLSEIWLGNVTDTRYETIVSGAQKKQLAEYENLLARAFCENFRVLRPGRYMSVVFHHASSNVWNSLRRAMISAGFQIVDASILDKQQTSFKQTTTSGAVKKDPIIVAQKPSLPTLRSIEPTLETPERFIQRKLAELEDGAVERTFDYLFSRYVGQCLSSGIDVTVDAKQFREVLAKTAELHGDRWYLRSEDR
jgi:DNA modification methylase